MANSTLTNESVYQVLKDKFGESVGEMQEPFGMLTIEVKANDAHDIVAFLKDEQSLLINYLTNVGVVHYPEQEGREIAVVYHLHSLINNFRIRIKAFISINKPEIASLTDLFVGANWMERESYDFFGVDFKGHPELTRILNDDSMDYFPLRKEYQLEDATREDKDNRFFGR